MHVPVSIAELTADLLKLLPSRMRRRFGLLLVASIGAAILESFTLAIVALFASSLSNAAAMLQTDILRRAANIIPDLQQLSAQGLVTALSLAVVVLMLAKTLARASVQYAQLKLTAQASGYLSDAMLTGFTHMPYRWLLERNSIDLVSTVSWATNGASMLGCVFTSVTELTVIVLLFAALILTNPLLILSMGCVLGLPAYALLRALRGRIDAIARELAQQRRVGSRHLTMTLQGVKEVKMYGQEDTFCSKYRASAFAIPQHVALQDLLSNVPSWIMECVGFTALCAISVFMLVLMGDSAARTTGTVAMIAVTAWRVLPAVIRIVASINKFREFIPYLTDTLAHLHAIETLAAPRRIKDPQSKRLMLTREITLQGVSFTYASQNRAVLHDVTFSIRKGESVGLVGESGAGKSTLVDILIGLHTPGQGHLQLDGQPLDGQEAASSQIFGYVAQSPYIYDATLAENVAFGLEGNEIDMKCVVEACTLAAVDEFLPALSEGYHTALGERGIRLSGGQQQRICIARALYHKPMVLVFDEATSALDAKSEQQIQQSIMALKGKVTMVIVAHRLSTVESCDKIIWLEDGRIKRIGPPSEVLPEYRNALQAEADQESCQ